MSHAHSFWQERTPPAPRSYAGFSDRKSSRGKFCSIALAIASFVVLVAVLSIAGMALYMGALHTETPNPLLTFSCSAKVMRGDRFIGALSEKARKYKRQFEALYQRSVLGPALVSCVVDSFGNDTFTVNFKLTLNRKKFTKSINIEKNIRDILLSDAISRKPMFRNIRFDPRNIRVRQVMDSEKPMTASSVITPKDPSKLTKNGVVLKSYSNSTPVHTTTKKPFINDEIDIEEEDLPVIRGSFKISKTDADITEKKTEITTSRPKNPEKMTTISNKKTTYKETSITSGFYKIAAIEKVTKATTEFSTSTSSTVSTTKTQAVPSTRESSTATITTTSASTKGSVFINPQIFDEEPWIPILPDVPNSANNLKNSFIQVQSTTTNSITLLNQRQPVYTSFTNPGLSFHFLNTEQLGSTSLKSHPIPVNKIPSATQPSTFLLTNPEVVYKKNPETTVPEDDTEKQVPDFIEIETVKYVPGTGLSESNTAESSLTDLKQEQIRKNISSIFHTLASSFDGDDLNITTNDFGKENNNSFNSTSSNEEGNFGQGQVEVVQEDVDDIILQTTKLPLVTLIPVKSNSGIMKPLRKRPLRPGDNNIYAENRSFPSQSTKQNANTDNTKADKLNKEIPVKNNLDDFKIVGVLNFATETTFPEDFRKGNDRPDLVRYPKMDTVTTDRNKSEIVVYATNSSISSSRSDISKSNMNILSSEQIKQLSEISHVRDNDTIFDAEPKTISSSYTINHSGFKILTKTFNKLNDNGEKNKFVGFDKNEVTSQNNSSDCGNLSVRCGDGKCLPETTKCNQLIDCDDGKDEQNCNCADYLRSQFLLRKICDGVVDCWDFSDENQCEWCRPQQYVCANSKVCIDREKICDTVRDCPQGDDERQCVTIAVNMKAAEEFPYYSDGYLMVRKHGRWGKLCVDNFQNVVSRSHISWKISDLGKAVCKSMTYQSMDTIKSVNDNKQQSSSEYFELSYSFQNETKSSLSFKEISYGCEKVVKVKCHTLECGARPQAVKHIARVVGGGNAGIGAWPWQGALYKEGEFQCGATLLSNRWLVSAGHCFYHSQEEHWVARLGALRRGTTLPSPYEQLRSIVRIIVHPGYVDSGFINDISLLQMEFPVIFSDYVRPVCLPKYDQPAEDGRLCTVIGWGQLFEVGRIFPDTLQEVQVPIISTAECRKRTLFLPLYRITDDMFCAGYERGGRDACLGDSGGPLICPEPNGRWVLHGITSNGFGCARANRPGVYTKVANYVGWITSEMAETSKGSDLNKTHTKIKSVCAGHRCPLGECLPKSRLCNGYIECSDGSDEKNC